MVFQTNFRLFLGKIKFEVTCQLETKLWLGVLGGGKKAGKDWNDSELVAAGKILMMQEKGGCRTEDGVQRAARSRGILAIGRGTEKRDSVLALYELPYCPLDHRGYLGRTTVLRPYAAYGRMLVLYYTGLYWTIL